MGSMGQFSLNPQPFSMGELHYMHWFDLDIEVGSRGSLDIQHISGFLFKGNV